MLAELSDKAYNASCISTSASSIGSIDSICSDTQSEFEDLTTVKTIYDGKFAVYLVLSPNSKRYYALKVFPWEENEPTTYFLREARFCKFNHPNIVHIPHHVLQHTAYYDETPTNISYMLMEYAKYGDMFNALVRHKLPFNETLVRTYFHQLIAGLEHLHNNGAAHLDIKLENLLIGDNYTLKIADFDLSYFVEDGAVRTRGTKNFRAPELYSKSCTNPIAADVYSAGIMLFLLSTKGNLPFLEDRPTKGLDMAEVKDSNPKVFWQKHCHLLGVEGSYFTNAFKKLFIGMTNFDASKRMTMAEVKASEWYNGEIYTKKELVAYMQEHLGF